jgi:hypothetical protein
MTSMIEGQGNDLTWPPQDGDAEQLLGTQQTLARYKSTYVLSVSHL